MCDLSYPLSESTIDGSTCSPRSCPSHQCSIVSTWNSLKAQRGCTELCAPDCARLRLLVPKSSSSCLMEYPIVLRLASHLEAEDAAELTERPVAYPPLRAAPVEFPVAAARCFGRFFWTGGLLGGGEGCGSTTQPWTKAGCEWSQRRRLSSAHRRRAARARARAWMTVARWWRASSVARTRRRR